MLEYRWGFGIDDLIMGVGLTGPAVIGVNWYEGMFDTDESGFIHVRGKARGGHAIMVRGVSLRNETFRLRNSWGRSWGQEGDCLLSFADAERLLNERGEVCFPVSRRRV
jgi:hypothetical protein